MADPQNRTYDELLNTFRLGGYQLQVNAPEEIREGLKAAYRFFFYKKSAPVVQVGRLTYQPMTFSFKLSGPDALATARHLKGVVGWQKALRFSWANNFDYEGFLTSFDFTYRQREVSGTLEFQPTIDHFKSGPQNALGKEFARINTATPDPVEQVQKADTAIAKGHEANTVLTLHLNACKEQLASELKPIADYRDAAVKAISEAQKAIRAHGDIASMPFQLSAAVVDNLRAAAGLVPAAIEEARGTIISPVVALRDTTTNYLMTGLGHSLMAQLDDGEVALLNLANAIQPPAYQHTALDGDTLQDVADAFGVSLGSILQMNPGLSAGGLSAGQFIQIPPNG